jgi:hypothetical protein
VEVKVGIVQTGRELVVETTASQDEVAATLTSAVQTGSVFELTDEKGRKILVPVAHLAYVEIGEVGERRVGFAL